MPTVNLTLTGQALSKVDDTNVTLTLGGTPLTALLKGVSITAGWTGQLSVARGGTGLGALGTANQLLRVNALGTALEYFTPSYGTVTAVTGSGNITSSGGATPNITFTGVLPTANGGTGVNIATTALTLGTASSAAGSIVLQNATNANTITIQSGVTTSSHTLTLPVANASGVLTNNGSGTLTWAASSSGITVGSTTITSGTSLRIPYNLAGVYQEQANFTIGSVATGVLDVPVGLAVGGTQILKTANSLFLGTGTPAIWATIACTFIGHNSGLNAITSNYCTFVGHGAGALTGASIGCVYIGYNNMVVSSSALTGSITMGYEVAATASHQGVLGGNNSTGYVDNWYYNGVTHTAPYGVNIRASGGSGSNINGADLSFYAGLPTGDGSNVAAGRNGIMSFWTGDAGASGTTLRSATEKIRISQKGNFLIGGTTENTSATKALVLANGTEASALLANAICIQSQDTSAGLASLSIYVEDTVQAVAAEVLSNYLRVRINGVEYKLAIIA